MYKAITRQEIIDKAQELHATKSATDCGAIGKTGHEIICYALGLKPINKPSGKKDLIKVIDGVRCTCEIKTTGGEIENFNNHKLDAVNNTYIIYAPYYDITKDILTQYFVFNARDFFNGMLAINALRFNKTATNGYVSRQYNRGSVKSFTHPLNYKEGRSLKKFNEINTFCIENGTRLDTFIKSHDIKHNIIDLQKKIVPLKTGLIFSHLLKTTRPTSPPLKNKFHEIKFSSILFTKKLIPKI